MRTPAIVLRAGAIGAAQAAFEQLASSPDPAPELLISTVVDESESPEGGIGPPAVKNKARAGAPVWSTAFVVSNRTSVESGTTPVHDGTSVPHTKR